MPEQPRDPSCEVVAPLRPSFDFPQKVEEAEDREERENAGLRELGQLPNLRCLEIEIEDLALAAENIRLSSKVDRFTIRFLYESRWFPKFDEYLSNKKICLTWEGATCLGDWIKMLLLKDTEYLLLVGNGANEVGLTNLEKKVVTSSMDKGGATVFPSIENLLLFKLPKLEEICDDRISSNSFQNLKILELNDLPALKQLWKSSQNDSGKDFLPQLEVLQIWRCEMMEAVFVWKGEDGNENNSCHPITKRFPKLKELELDELPNLKSFCQGIEGIEFPLMRKILIRDCGKMKGMVWNEKISGGVFCPQQVSFSELEELAIIGCQSIMSLFTSSMAGNLVNLKELWISLCDEMVEVIKDDEEKGMSGGRQTALLFPKLQKLELLFLPKLVSFYESKGIESIMEITKCEKMKGMVANGVTSNENNSGGSSTNAADIIFCQSKQVSFGCLKELETGRNPFCSHTIHVSIFDRLEVLDIRGYKGSMSLFSSSITGNLVNLTTLTIINCEKMVKVIEEKEEEKEKVVSGAQRTTILFPKLHKIELWDLPALVRFCEWKCDVELPSLREVEIGFCHNMKRFSLGPLNTPNLEMVKIDNEDFGGEKDLNGLVQQQQRKKMKRKTMMMMT